MKEKMNRTLVIGDIHGGLRALHQIMERANVTTKDELIFLGDYVDGWSQSPQVIDYLTDITGTPSHYYNYLPFGEEMVAQNNSSYNNVYRFSAKELDEDTGLSYFGARYYDPKFSIWLSVDPLAEEFFNYSPYNYCLQNPINLVDPTGMSPTDIVWFNSQGIETNRIKSNTQFVTFVEKGLNYDYSKDNFFNKFSNYVQVQMPNVIQTRTQSNEDVTGPKYQVNDYQIAASTYLTNQELNSGNIIVADRGGNIIPQSNLTNVSDISVDTVKAWSMQESHAGTTGNILQVNNAGDYTNDKLALGITNDAVFSTHQEINLAIRYAIGKGFSVTGVVYSNNGKTVNRTYEWKGWSEAIKGYGPGAKNPNYQNYINTMQNESVEPKLKNY